MSKAIWKFQLSMNNKIEMPKDAKILHVDTQNDILCLWALVDPKAEKEERIFTIYGTGHSIEGDFLKHIGSAQMGPFVWHVFEETV